MGSFTRGLSVLFVLLPLCHVNVLARNQRFRRSQETVPDGAPMSAPIQGGTDPQGASKPGEPAAAADATPSAEASGAESNPSNENPTPSQEPEIGPADPLGLMPSAEVPSPIPENQVPSTDGQPAIPPTTVTPPAGNGQFGGVPAQNATSQEPNKDSGDKTEESLADYLINQIVGTSTPQVDCSLSLNVSSVCPDVPAVVNDFFENNLNLDNILKYLFDPSIVKQLDISCNDSNWCLSEEYREILEESAAGFYKATPFCTTGMQHCVLELLTAQATCEDKPQFRVLTLLNNTLHLLCDKTFATQLTGDCFASTMEMLYLTYTNQQKPNEDFEKHKADLEKDDCNNAVISMNSMYKCAKRDCVTPEQAQALNTFPEWYPVISRSEQILQLCPQAQGSDQTCESQRIAGAGGANSGNTEDEDVQSENLDDYFNEEEEEEEEEEEFIQYIEELQKEYDEQEEQEKNAAADSENHPAFLYGMVALCGIVVIVFIVIAIVSYRRVRRGDNAYIGFARGYSQLDQDEETRMLAHAFN